jgi:hypothetical protein
MRSQVKEEASLSLPAVPSKPFLIPLTLLLAVPGTTTLQALSHNWTCRLTLSVLGSVLHLVNQRLQAQTQRRQTYRGGKKGDQAS